MKRPLSALTGVVLLILVVAVGLRHCSRPPLDERHAAPPVVVSVNTPTVPPADQPIEPPPVIEKSTPVQVPPPVAKPTPTTPKPAKAAPKPKATPALTTPSGAPIAPKVALHPELIPKDITIVRLYSPQQITPPGSSIGFDLNGSGFTSEFKKMISVDANAADIHVENLKLVTANQIHGDFIVGPNAATAFVFPRVLIKKLPVFSAPDPFAVVRKGEVLTIIFISMEDNGRGGRFRVLTNIDDAQMKQFQVVPSTPALQISEIQPILPFRVEGLLHIGPGLPTGGYGLSVRLAGKEIFRHDGMIRIVRPNVGHSGFAQGLVAEDPFHRPGDIVQLYLQGTGLAPEDVNQLNAKVDEFNMGRGTFSYVSPVQARLAFIATSTAPVGSYGVTVSAPSGEVLYQKKNVFQIVAPNWVAGLQVQPPVKAGAKSTLRILGRDFSPAFVQSLKIETDESGVHIQNLRVANLGELDADIAVDASVAPGDYWLHLSDHGHAISPPYGSLIKVQP